MTHQLLKYFAYEHLPESLQLVSKPIGELAEKMDKALTDSAEKTAGLRKLLEAKDCLVRAKLDEPKVERQTETPYADLSFDEKESDRKEADKFLLALSIENKKDGFAYSQALAFESLELREKFDQDKKEFNGVTFDDIERYAKIVAYKVANNLKNGFVMDNNDDPLNYGNE